VSYLDNKIGHDVNEIDQIPGVFKEGAIINYASVSDDLNDWVQKDKEIGAHFEIEKQDIFYQLVFFILVIKKSLSNHADNRKL
jgi:hypothetical protein